MIVAFSVSPSGGDASVFDEESLAELVHSIREFGLMQPIVVRAVVQPPPTARPGIRS